MLDYAVVLAARQRTEELVHEALPNSPVRADGVPTWPTRAAHGLRYGLSAALHRLADAVEPAPRRRASAAEGC